MPTISIIIPTYHRAASLRRCLEAVGGLRVPPEGFDVIVVEDGSAHPIDRTIFPDGLQAARRIIRSPVNLGPAAARNLGAEAARGECLVFLDDDCTPSREWLIELRGALAKHPGAACGGPVVEEQDGNLYAAASNAIFDFAFRYYNRDGDRARFLGTANLAVPADRFREIGGFDSEFRASEDREFCRRWIGRGWRMVSVPGAVVTHRQESGLGRFFRRHFEYGRGAYRVRALAAASTGSRIRLEPRSFYWRLLAQPLSIAPWPRGALVAGLVALSQFASALGFLAEHLSPSTADVRLQENSIGRN